MHDVYIPAIRIPFLFTLQDNRSYLGSVAGVALTQSGQAGSFVDGRYYR